MISVVGNMPSFQVGVWGSSPQSRTKFYHILLTGLSLVRFYLVIWVIQGSSLARVQFLWVMYDKFVKCSGGRVYMQGIANSFYVG